MTLKANVSGKLCFAPCPKDKVDNGLCECHNRSTNISNDFIHSVVRSCYWCDEPITNKDETEELPDGRGKAHCKCTEEFYGSKMAED